MTDPRKTYQWQRLAKRTCPPGSVCYLCGQPIEFGLRRNHPRGPSVDHIVALDNGGAPFDPTNLAPAHFGCNGAKAARAFVPDTWSSW
jgi:5-methylcytosine-specific restriction endonuclease McrA